MRGLGAAGRPGAASAWMRVALGLAMVACSVEEAPVGPPRCEPSTELLVERGLKRGYREIVNRDSRAAEKAFREVLKQAPGHPEARSGLLELERLGRSAALMNSRMAIMVAGRSGSAFAAQIGTMKLTEEIDAMRTIGISPIEALVIPRILACVFMMVLLGFYASVMAVIGGAVISDVMLGIPFWTFLMRIQEVVPTYDVWVGLIKAPVFGLIIAVAGCYQGMQVHGNSEEVGKRTTKAVVQAIFTVIVLDAFFAVFFTNVGWA